MWEIHSSLNGRLEGHTLWVDRYPYDGIKRAHWEVTRDRDDGTPVCPIGQPGVLTQKAALDVAVAQSHGSDRES